VIIHQLSACTRHAYSVESPTRATELGKKGNDALWRK